MPLFEYFDKKRFNNWYSDVSREIWKDIEINKFCSNYIKNRINDFKDRTIKLLKDFDRFYHDGEVSSFSIEAIERLRRTEQCMTNAIFALGL